MVQNWDIVFIYLFYILFLHGVLRHHVSVLFMFLCCAVIIFIWFWSQLCILLSWYRIWQSSTGNDILMIQDTNPQIPKGHTFLLGFLSHIYAFMCMFARHLWVALRVIVMHEDIHTPVCFLVAASQDRPGLGTPGNIPFG